MKKILLVLTLALCAPMTFAQNVPSNVPTDGLVGYWPFNGNANDESGNGNNGTPINGVLLTTDRFNKNNSAYSFNGVNNFIQIVNPNIPQGNSSRTISSWFYLTPTIGYNDWYSILSYGNELGDGFLNDILIQSTIADFNCNNFFSASNPLDNLSSNWHNIIVTYDSLILSNIKIYIDSVLIQTNLTNYNGILSLNTQLTNLYFGKSNVLYDSYYYFNGKIDDVGIWNRALTQEEITQLYYAENSCQSLVINTGVLSFNPPTYNNTVTIYPNPANDHITIDCGNLANVSGWSIKIYNTLGQEVFSGAMNTQQYVVPLNRWSGQGVYFVKIYDASNQLMNTKKIILQ